ncbi:uncharacterized protein BXZ73DRAFT_90762 [Epithele typhae]|uniref:uncharacterized protein n=1 Tax=Epithele typhae TaxID=378194 RepID=UPI00200736FE|nr:uncharacterized protein BXZ73DRAFT_90762 [Epithele typhae]KAH9927515.1 hypothetical protein BXZ73DRAFT_90762 [Epithele typhae]
MQNHSSYYAVPKCDGRIWADWQQSGRSANVSLCVESRPGSSCQAPLPRRSPLKDTTQCSAMPMAYSLTPPTPEATDSDASSSQISMESIPEYDDDMPEIPFVSATIAGEDEFHPSFWTGLIGMRPSISKSSTASSIVPPPSPPRSTRKRAGSVTSIASSRTRPAPAKSILSSSESAKTRRRKAPSVKFLDVPTIHYEEDDYHDDYDHDPCGGASHEPSSSACLSPPPPKKARGLSGFFSFKWLFGSSSSSRTTSSQPSSPPSRKAKTKKGVVPGRPAISGPYPLCETVTATARSERAGGSSAASLRSVKSNTSIGSVRSCGNRLPTPTYWPR